MQALLLLLALAQPAPPPVDVRIVTDEADAVLSILARKAQEQPVTDADWQRLFSSEGYVRLKKRDTQMGRPFEDADFRTFVLSEDLAKRAPDLTRTLGLWTAVDPSAAARRALAYLPEGARIRAKVYPVIKPKDNSFVFEVKTDPAIFLYLDPAVPPEKLENTLAHELHHIGFGGSCPAPAVEAEIAKLPPANRTALLWMGGFGEGIAMLAAAGGPGVHPHAASPAADRERWDRDVARFPEDLRRIEAFFRDVLAGKLSEEEAQKTAMTFYGEQGPWYTVGWKMAATIETALGRDRLVAAACDPRRLLPAYNEAARKLGEGLPLWSIPVTIPREERFMSEGERRAQAVHAAAYKDSTERPPEALETLFREHHGSVFRAAYRITGDPADAEDVLQTVFTRLLRREEQPDLSESAGSYLHRAAVNAALDLIRARKRARTVDLEGAGDLVDHADPGPERRQGSRELARRLREAMTRLSPRQAEIFAMRYFEGLGNLEISRLLGATQTSIAVILHRARHRLQKEMGPLQGELS